MTTRGGSGETTVLVTTTKGPIRGLEEGGISVFRGVRYAAPPVGEARFKPPAIPRPWSEPADCSRFGPVAPQPAIPFADDGPTQEQNEDCLFLNVYTPACDDGRRPVMFWLHGGGFTIGSGSSAGYDGTRFAKRHDVVVVTINYRLGVLGYLELGEREGYERSGNSGLLDQIYALAWVRDNIAAFGGNPDNVTIFGESAGAASVGFLMAAPDAAGLFHKAIAQSGAAATRRTRETAQEVTRRMCDALGSSIDDLLTAPVERLLEGQQTFAATEQRELGFSPTVDGKVLPPPLDRIASGSAATVPLIIGTNRDEANLFALMMPTASDVGEDELVQRMRAAFGDRAQRALETYRASRPRASNQDLSSAFFTDLVFRVPAVRMAEQQAKHAATYMYLFAWATPAMGGVLGACHGLEIPFVWNLTDQSSIFMPSSTPAAEELSLAMHDAWAAFAHTGDPNHPGLPAWPQYEPSGRPTMIFDRERTVEFDPGGSELALF
jgi:para-nitrobenzyl esterase